MAPGACGFSLCSCAAFETHPSQEHGFLSAVVPRFADVAHMALLCSAPSCVADLVFSAGPVAGVSDFVSGSNSASAASRALAISKLSFSANFSADSKASSASASSADSCASAANPASRTLASSFSSSAARATRSASRRSLSAIASTMSAASLGELFPECAPLSSPSPLTSCIRDSRTRCSSACSRSTRCCWNSCSTASPGFELAGAFAARASSRLRRSLSNCSMSFADSSSPRLRSSSSNEMGSSFDAASSLVAGLMLPLRRRSRSVQ